MDSTGAYNLTGVVSMVQQSVTMRVMAERNKALAKTAAFPADRERYGEYVKLYREMETRFAEAEKTEDHDRPR